jgi:hypothetical protein
LFSPYSHRWLLVQRCSTAAEGELRQDSRDHELLQPVFPEPIEEIRAELLRFRRCRGERVKTGTDGTGVIGVPSVKALITAGHQVLVDARTTPPDL